MTHASTPNGSGDPRDPGQRAGDAPGESRRELLRKGAMVGGLVWAAPVINSAGRLAADGSPPSTTSTTSPNFVTTTTTAAPVCDCTFCATITTPSGATLYFIGAGKTERDCDCLCKCGGIDRPCDAPNPCEVEVVFTPSPTPCS